VKALGSTKKPLFILASWSDAEVDRIPGVAVKCVDIGRNTRGEGGPLGIN
jgi:hypothetical protein